MKVMATNIFDVFYHPIQTALSSMRMQMIYNLKSTKDGSHITQKHPISKKETMQGI